MEQTYNRGDRVRIASFPRWVGTVIALLDTRLHGGIQWYAVEFDGAECGANTVCVTHNTASELIPE
jgi:hypothetical protein